MKLACASTAFDRKLHSGELTQLEWIDLCARELEVDGIVCDALHFPRRDGDYLAQVKKMAVDLGLTIAAVSSEEFFTGNEDAMRDALALADAIGAPILAAPLELETATTWSGELERIGAAAALAKALNVTLAVRNGALTFAAGSHDLKRVSKEADSAWLRYALDLEGLEGGSDPEAILSKAVLLWHMHTPGEIESEDSPAAARLLDAGAQFRGFLALDIAGGSADRDTMRNAVRKWRALLAQDALGRSL